MTGGRILRIMMAFVVCIGFIMMGGGGYAAPSWLDQIEDVARYHQELAAVEGKAATYMPYLDQLELIRGALRAGDSQAAYNLMNQFMDMLQAREAGIPAWSARVLYDVCGAVTPAKYHDMTRHLPRL